MKALEKTSARKKLSAREWFYKYLNPFFNSPYVLVAPAAILSIIFSVYPVGYTFVNSLYYWDTMKDIKRFVGFDNYTSIFKDAEFLRSLSNTATYTLIYVIVGLTLAILCAVFLFRSNWMYQFVQGVVFTPHIVSWVSITMMWMWLMDPRSGMLNFVLGLVGIEPLKWMVDEKTSLASVILVAVWKQMGYSVTIAIAGLKGIPPYIYEAVRLDKSNSLRTFFKITIPMLSPTLLFLLVTSFIDSFCAFDTVYLMTKGGPRGSSNILVHWIYQMGFEYFRTGESMAASVVLLFIIGFVSVLNFTVLNKKVHYQ